MSILHTYKLVESAGGAEHPFSELRVTSAVLERNLDSRGDRLELTLACGRERGPTLPLGARLDLVDSAGQTRFSGWLLAPELLATGGRQEHRYVLQGPQWWLQRITYLQAGWNFATEFASLEGELESARHGRVIFNQRSDFTAATIPEQLADVLAWSQNQGAPLSFTLAGLPEILPPEAEFTDLTAWQCLERLLTWLPHWHWRWEYHAGASPRLRFLEAGALRPLAATACTALRAAQRQDLLTGTLEVQFVQTHSQLVNDGADGQVRRDWLERVLQTSVSGPYPGKLRTTRYLRGGLRTLVFDEDLGQYVEETLVAAEGTPAADLAAILHTAYAQPAVEWEATMESGEVDWSWQPGDRLRVTGVHGGWSEGVASALVGTVRHTLELGRTELEAGSFARLPLDDLIGGFGQQQSPTSFSERKSGQTDRTKSGFGSDQPTASRIRIYGCADGHAVYYLFRPSIVNGPYPV